jgi:hypothetical protein
MESSAIASQPSLLDDVDHVAHISICHRQISVPVAIDEVTVLGSSVYTSHRRLHPVPLRLALTT